MDEKETQRGRAREGRQERIGLFLFLLVLSLSMRTAMDVKGTERKRKIPLLLLGLPVLLLVSLFSLILLSLLPAYLLFLSLRHSTSCSIVRKVEN